MSEQNKTLAEAPEITDLAHIKFDVFRLEQEERQLQFLITSHRIQAGKMEKKGKRGLAALHADHGRKLLEEIKAVRADLNEMKNQLDDATGE